MENLSFDVSISYNCKTDIDTAMALYFLGYGQTDFLILVWKRVDQQKISAQSSELGVSIPG